MKEKKLERKKRRQKKRRSWLSLEINGRKRKQKSQKEGYRKAKKKVYIIDIIDIERKEGFSKNIAREKRLNKRYIYRGEKCKKNTFFSFFPPLNTHTHTHGHIEKDERGEAQQKMSQKTIFVKKKTVNRGT